MEDDMEDEMPRKADEIGKAIARALGLDPRDVRMLSAGPSMLGMGEEVARGGDRLERMDELFDMHKADALAVVEAAKEQKHAGMCCEGCAVRAIAGGQLEGALLAVLRNEDDEHLWETARAASGLVIEMLEVVMAERKAKPEVQA